MLKYVNRKKIVTYTWGKQNDQVSTITTPISGIILDEDEIEPVTELVITWDNIDTLYSQLTGIGFGSPELNCKNRKVSVNWFTRISERSFPDLKIVVRTESEIVTPTFKTLFESDTIPWDTVYKYLKQNIQDINSKDLKFKITL